MPFKLKLPSALERLQGKIHTKIHNSVIFRTIVIRYPQIGGGLMSAFKAAGADYFAQTQVDSNSYKENGFNFRRNFLFALLGFTHGGFINYFVHSFLNPKLFGDNTRAYTIIKIILWNQFIYTPAFAFPLFYGYKGLVYSNGNLTAAKDSIKLYLTENIKHDVFMAFKVWGPAHIVTYRLIPRRYRVYWINLVSFAWTTILSTVRGANTNNIDDNNDNNEKMMDANIIDGKNETGFAIYDENEPNDGLMTPQPQNMNTITMTNDNNNNNNNNNDNDNATYDSIMEKLEMTQSMNDEIIENSQNGTLLEFATLDMSSYNDNDNNSNNNNNNYENTTDPSIRSILTHDSQTLINSNSNTKIDLNGSIVVNVGNKSNSSEKERGTNFKNDKNSNRMQSSNTTEFRNNNNNIDNNSNINRDAKKQQKKNKKRQTNSLSNNDLNSNRSTLNDTRHTMTMKSI